MTADTIEGVQALGAAIDLSPAGVARCFEATGIGLPTLRAARRNL